MLWAYDLDGRLIPPDGKSPDNCLPTFADWHMTTVGIGNSVEYGSSRYDHGPWGCSLLAVLTKGNPVAEDEVRAYTIQTFASHAIAIHHYNGKFALLEDSRNKLGVKVADGNTSIARKVKSQQEIDQETNLIKSVQQELARIGYDIEPDGVAGPGTLKVINDFQRSVKLPPSTAITPELLATLREQSPDPALEAGAHRIIDRLLANPKFRLGVSVSEIAGILKQEGVNDNIDETNMRFRKNFNNRGWYMQVYLGCGNDLRYLRCTDYGEIVRGMNISAHHLSLTVSSKKEKPEIKTIFPKHFGIEPKCEMARFGEVEFGWENRIGSRFNCEWQLTSGESRFATVGLSGYPRQFGIMLK